MAGQFRIAEGYVEVTADESGYNRAMDRLKSKRTEVGVGLKLDDREARVALDRFVRDRSLKVKLNLDDTALSRLRLRDLAVNISPKISEAAERIVRNKLDRLTTERVVRIRADVDTRVGANEIANLTRRRTVRIGMDVDTRVAADDIANLTRRRQMTIQANADVTAAAARLATLTRDRTVTIRTRTVGGLVGLGESAAGAGMLSSRFAGLAAAALSALPAVASLGQSIISMGPAAAVAVPALGGLVTVVGTLALGLSGIGAAFKAAGSSSGQSGAQAATAARAVAAAQLNVARAARTLKEAQQDAARQIVDAQKQVKEAAEDVRDAEVRAAAERQAALRRIADAERDLTDAVKDAQQAEEDLTQARKEASEQLEDLNNRLVDAQLDQRQAVRDVQDAEKELAAVKAKGAAATAAELEDAQIGYDRATQRLKEQQIETARLQDETASANTAGVEGSEAVEAAHQKVADAQRTVGDRTREVKDAQAEAAKTAKDGAESVRDAQQKLADAQQGVADAQVAASRQVRSAQEALADAQRSVNSAQSQGAATTDKYADAMAKLSPNARAFVTAVRSMGPAFSALKMDVQDRLFRGLAASVTRLGAAALPALRTGLGGMADVLNGMAVNLLDTFTKLGNQGLLTRMFQGFTDGMAPLTKVPGQLGQAFVQLSVAASPAFRRITTAMANESTKISEKLTDAFESGRLEGAIDHAIDLGKKFGRVLGNAFGALKNIFKAAEAGNGGALGAVADAVAELRRITGLPGIQNALTTIFKAFNDIAGVIVDVIGVALENLVPIAAPFADMLSGIADTVKGPLMTFFGWLGDHQTLVGSLAAGILAIVGGMKLWALATAVLTGAQAILTAVMSANPIGIVVLALAGLAAAFAYAWSHSEKFRDIVKGVWETVSGFFAGTWDMLYTYVVKPFVDLYDILVGHSIIPDLVNAVTTWFKSLWTGTKKIFTDLKNAVVGIWNSLWGTIREKWNSFWSGLKSSFTGAWKVFRDSVTSLKTSITNTWNSLWNGAKDKLTSIFTTINGKITSFKNGMKSAFTALRDSLGTIWNGIKTKIGAPVKFVIASVYNQGIRKMWNSIAGKISSKITLPAVPIGFSAGGVVPGQRSNRDSVPAVLAPGERVLSNAQVDQLGGHRGIDAMLGKDRPTGTGGDPSASEERRRYQGSTQHFVDGGIVGKVTSAVSGAVSGATSWAKDVFVGGMKSAAQKALSALVRPLIGRIPSSGIGNLMRGLSNKAVDGMLGWFGNEDKKAKGGPAVQKALSWMKTQAGLPYQWAGNGNPSWDCSGLMSAIESVIRGERPHRRWATGAFGSSAPSGWVRNLNSPFMIGITNAGVGHTAGTLAGVNVESSGGAGVHMGSSARGYKDSLFTSQWGFAPAAKYDQGGLLADGATMVVKQTRKPERVLDPQQTALFEQLVTGAGAAGASGITIEQINMTVQSLTMPSSAEKKKFADGMVYEIKESLRRYDESRRR
ncbi:hypothetical protein GFH48_12740 [Streptomyces fagopyri]|uniref:Tape measure protein n=1 Tax=Streptomyces fagopyri TaxID=2662397 RepID=A0A5Q0LB87_9ACTN|nr:hypothetical protein [Streptomyces fagopyri]QFZ73996.1 hypothetical protein GFH48_12740 [Streptomyces fagopyri]